MGMIHILNRWYTYCLPRLRVKANASAGFRAAQACAGPRFTPVRMPSGTATGAIRTTCRRLRRKGDRDSKALHPDLPTGEISPGSATGGTACRCPDLRSVLLAVSTSATRACTASDRVYSMHAVPRWVKGRLHLPECDVAVVGAQRPWQAHVAHARSVPSSAPACTRSASSAHGNARAGHASRRGNQQKTPAFAGVFNYNHLCAYSAFAACTTCSAVILKYVYN